MYVGVIGYLTWKAARGERTPGLAPSAGEAEVEAARDLVGGPALPVGATAEASR